MKTPMNAVAISVTVHMVWASDTIEKDELVTEATKLFTEYVAGPNNFRDDYGPGAWGGYDGPFVVEVAAARVAQHYKDDQVLVEVEED